MVCMAVINRRSRCRGLETKVVFLQTTNKPQRITKKNSRIVHPRGNVEVNLGLGIWVYLGRHQQRIQHLLLLERKQLSHVS